MNVLLQLAEKTTIALLTGTIPFFGFAVFWNVELLSAILESINSTCIESTFEKLTLHDQVPWRRSLSVRGIPWMVISPCCTEISRSWCFRLLCRTSYRHHSCKCWFISLRPQVVLRHVNHVAPEVSSLLSDTDLGFCCKVHVIMRQMSSLFINPWGGSSLYLLFNYFISESI